MTEKLMSKEFKDLVLELLDAVDRIRQGGLLGDVGHDGPDREDVAVRLPRRLRSA